MSVLVLFSLDPPLPDRRKAMRTEFQRTLPPRDTASVSTSDFEANKEHLRSWNPPNSNKPDGTTPTLRKSVRANIALVSRLDAALDRFALLAESRDAEPWPSLAPV
jgi:hypothetical protein